MFDLPAYPNAHRPVTSSVASPNGCARVAAVRHSSAGPVRGAQRQGASANAYGPARGALVSAMATMHGWQPLKSDSTDRRP